MDDRDTSRQIGRQGLRAVLFCLFALGLTDGRAVASGLRARSPQVPAPIERRPPSSSNGLPPTAPTGVYGTSPAPVQRHAPATHGPRGEHLAEWMHQHSSLSPEQQQQALGREPGFQALAPDTQQRMRDRLLQLDAMNPEQRQRLLARNEAMERLTPDQRADVRGALGQLGALPLDQRRAVAQTFHALRDLPPQQRMPAFNSGRFGPPLNDGQRATLFNLLRVEPMLPPPMRAAPPNRPVMPYPAQPSR